MRSVLLATSLLLGQKATAPLALEIRVFTGAEEVTSETRVSIHRAGERAGPIAQAQARNGQHVFAVPAGIYDVQVVRERDGRVVSIRWAERLVVMLYPDEGGRHLEVVNFTNGYGALQVRSARAGGVPDLAVYAAGERSRPVATAIVGENGQYALFVLPSGRYDVQVRGAERPTWHADIEVPLDRTRLWLLP
jgi:hypothetical protein